MLAGFLLGYLCNFLQKRKGSGGEQRAEILQSAVFMPESAADVFRGIAVVIVGGGAVQNLLADVGVQNLHARQVDSRSSSSIVSSMSSSGEDASL